MPFEPHWRDGATLNASSRRNRKIPPERSHICGAMLACRWNHFEKNWRTRENEKRELICYCYYSGFLTDIWS
jgi:hypothetical protein